MNLVKSVLAVSISLALLSGCGSDVDDKPNELDKPINTAPIINVNDTAVVEKQAVSISATVEDEGPVTYFWSQNSGLSVTLENTDTQTVSFVAPSVSEDEKISLNLTVTDSEGLTSEKNIVVDIQQQLVKLSLEGIATDSPLIDAAIKAKIGSQEFTTITNSDGYYSLELALDDDADMGQLVTIEAQGTEEQQAALLQSRLMSFASLKTKAGDDAVLTNDEDFSVNITNLTTAKSALLARENLYADIKTEQDLKRLSSEINAEELVKVATAIKVILDKSADNESLGLPEGFSNVLELALDNEKMTQYIKEVEQTPEFSQAQEEMLADEKVVDKSEQGNLDALYFNQGWEYFNNPMVELNADGSGRYLQSDLSGSLQWSYDNNVYTLQNPEGFTNYASSQHSVVDGQNVYTDIDVSVYKAEITILSSDENGVLIKEKSYSKIHYPNGEQPDQQETSEITTQAFTSKQQVDFSLGQTSLIAVPMPSVLFEQADVTLNAATLKLNSDGSGELVELNNTPIQWQLIADGAKQSLQITLTEYDNRRFLFRQLSQGDGVINIAVLGEASDIGIGSEITPSEQFTMRSVPSVYNYAVYNQELSGFWFELWPDGRLITVSTDDNDANGELSTNEVSVTKGNWQLINGKLIISRNIGGEDCYYTVQNPNCWEYNRREWSIFEDVGESVYVTNKMLWAFGQQSSLAQARVDNRKYNRVTERPVSLPDEILQQIGQQPFVALTGLLDATHYVDKTLYAGVHDYWFDELLATIKLDQNQQYTLTHNEDASTGDYDIFSDGQVILRGNTIDQTQNYGFLVESNDVVIGAYNGLPWPHFDNEADAKEYMNNVAGNKPVSNVEHLIGRNIYMVDRDRDDKWVVSYLKFAENKVTIYSDESFTTINTELDYSVDDTGMISFPDDQNTMYLSLVTNEFNIIITNDEGNNSKDFNYFLFDHQKAKNFVNNTNALRDSALR